MRTVRIRAAYRSGTRYGALAVRRVQLRRDPRPKVAVLSGAGDDNFGDEWMYAALEEGFRGCALVPLDYPRTEGRLARVGLSGAGFFDGLLIGGGTLINPYFLPRAADLVEQDVPAWSVGTGVGSAGFGVPESSADPAEWAAMLRRFRRLTVRGPISASKLEPLPVEVMGDLALFHTPSEPLTGLGGRVALINVSGTEAESLLDSGASDRAVQGELVGVIRGLRDQGWTCRPLVVHRDDEVRLLALGKEVGGWGKEVPFRPYTHADLRPSLVGVELIIAMRLHASAIGWMHGIPTVALAYRNKTHDFARHLGVKSGLVDLQAFAVGSIEEACRRAARSDRSEEMDAFEMASLARDHLRQLMAEIRVELLDDHARR